MKKFDKKELLSIPNIMGYFRILMIPVFCYLYLTAKTERDIWMAAAVVLISSLTDMLDGLVARKFNMITEFGKFLDPFADKLTHAALAICLAVRYPMMWNLIGLMVIKEGYMAVMGLILIKKGKKLDGAMWFGKICTAILFLGMLALFLTVEVPQNAANGLIFLMMLVMLSTLIMYIPVFEKMRKA